MMRLLWLLCDNLLCHNYINYFIAFQLLEYVVLYDYQEWFIHRLLSIVLIVYIWQYSRLYYIGLRH